MKKLWIINAMMLISTIAFADTELGFKGTLISDPCIVDTDKEDQTVDMGTIGAKTFINNKRSAPKSFSLYLKECDLSLGSTVSVTFSGPEESQQPGTFAVTGGAEGVAIALESTDGSPVMPDESIAAGLTSGDTQLNYVAYVQANDFSKVKEGPFESRVIFSLEYE